jgi:2,4'-dihydroxyacetophenone dioxygenase
VFFVIVGELLFVDDNGDIAARENHLTSIERYLAHCRAHGITPHNLTACQ